MKTGIEPCHTSEMEHFAKLVYGLEQAAFEKLNTPEETKQFPIRFIKIDSNSSLLHVLEFFIL